VNHHELWLSASLACNFLLVLLSTSSCLFLIRRLDRIVRARDTSEQRVIQLTFELRRLEQRVAQIDTRGADARAEPPTTLKAPEPAPSLIAVPSLSYHVDTEEADEDAASLAEKHGDVWALVEAGRELAEIAEATGRPIGQVELIAGLYRQYQRSRTAGDHARAT
jgi:hypothetical protein